MLARKFCKFLMCSDRGWFCSSVMHIFFRIADSLPLPRYFTVKVAGSLEQCKEDCVTGAASRKVQSLRDTSWKNQFRL